MPEDIINKTVQDTTMTPRRSSILWYGVMVPVEFEQVRESSIQELRFSGHGVGDSFLMAKYREMTYIDTDEFTIDRKRMYEIMTHPVNDISICLRAKRE